MKENILNLVDVYKSFGNNHIHQGVSLHVKKGESLGLLGGSGTGKSVLLRSIIGLEKIDQGQIYYHDERIDNLNEVELIPYRLKISYSFQSGALFDSSNVFDNLAYPLYEHTKMSQVEINNKVSQMLEMVDLAGKEYLMPSDLSGGMRKRVGMARSMILNPEIILYDEPTAGLDPANAKNVIHIMKNLKKLGQSSIFVTHEIPAAIDFCDRIVVLDSGKVIFNDTPDAFLNEKNPIIKEFISNEGY
ncbi:MAG: ATP-binding cassette domain-containing protein [Halobacteriovoraceae bacterium]|nr:ATP-binding cassette domain-containing protein [Halobacteriovoraceae bacterium]